MHLPIMSLRMLLTKAWKTDANPIFYPPGQKMDTATERQMNKLNTLIRKKVTKSKPKYCVGNMH